MKLIQNYTILTFNFLKKKNHKHFKNNTDLQSKLWWQKNSKKSVHILEDGTSGVQVGDIEQVIV